MIPLNNDAAAAIEENKNAITSMLMYSHKAFMDAGFSTEDAKRHVMKMVEGIYQSFGEAADVPATGLGGPLQRLESTIKRVEEHAKKYPEARDIYYDLLSIHSQLMKRKQGK